MNQYSSASGSAASGSRNHAAQHQIEKGTAMSTAGKSFRLAPMSPLIRTLTLGLLLLPVFGLVGVAFGLREALVPSLIMVPIIGWIWLRFRPSRFVVGADALEVIWPLKFRRIPRESITAVLLLDRTDLHRKIGWGVRVGAGGLWGGFGWLWTWKRGIVQIYVSRTDGFVWIERGGDRPWLITPEQPECFVGILSSSSGTPPAGFSCRRSR